MTARVEAITHTRMLEPVEILVEQDHQFKRKPKWRDEKRDKMVQPPGCAVCNGAKTARQHLGAPPTLNDGGSGMDRMAYQSLKRAWMDAFRAELDALGDALPRGLAAVTVEVMCVFPVRRDRDEGNHRWMIEKAFGDTLVEGGWLPSDSFHPVRRYSMGNLEADVVPGRSATRLMIFPTAASMEVAA